jgi:hypothetical protein
MFRGAATGRNVAGAVMAKSTSVEPTQAVRLGESGVRWIVVSEETPSENNRWPKVAVFDLFPVYGRRGPPKRVYSLNHNGERFAKGTEFKLFAERFPEAVPVIEAAMFGESQGGNSNQGERP